MRADSAITAVEQGKDLDSIARPCPLCKSTWRGAPPPTELGFASWRDFAERRAEALDVAYRLIDDQAFLPLAKVLAREEESGEIDEAGRDRCIADLNERYRDG